MLAAHFVIGNWTDYPNKTKYNNDKQIISFFGHISFSSLLLDSKKSFKSYYFFDSIKLFEKREGLNRLKNYPFFKKKGIEILGEKWIRSIVKFLVVEGLNKIRRLFSMFKIEKKFFNSLTTI